MFLNSFGWSFEKGCFHNCPRIRNVSEIILKETEIDSVKTAIELRTKENNMWDELFDGKTQELTAEFLKEINTQSHKKSAKR